MQNWNLDSNELKVLQKFKLGGCYGPDQFTKEERKILKKLKKYHFLSRITDKEVDYYFITPRGTMYLNDKGSVELVEIEETEEVEDTDDTDTDLHDKLQKHYDYEP